MKNPLLDLEFLRKLDLMKNKATYAKIVLLTWDENPVYEIQGKITTGSINIDGNSAVRRTCSLTMVSSEVDITNTHWALKNKFKLEVGIENKTDSQYPQIIWLKQGIYVFTSLNMSVQSNNFTISLNGKDKTCLLNGEVGGSINASTDFGKIEEYSTLDNGENVRNVVDIPIIDIIKNMLHTYAGQPQHNIILNDIDNYGVELLEYRGDNNLYMPREVDSGEVSNLIINSRQQYYREDGSEVYVDNIENENEEIEPIVYYDRTGLNTNKPEDEGGPTKLWSTPTPEEKDKVYNIIKIEYGETAGYRQTELTYPGELVANVGESLVSILDKIKKMFGDFEYFFDVDGRFIFQKKKTYINTSWNNMLVQEDQIYANDAAYSSAFTYSFEDGLLLSAFTNNPQILNIRNDYSIWGVRKGVSGADIPIHMRYAIDLKPVYYRPIRFEYKEVDLNKRTYQPNVYYTKSELTGKYILSTDASYSSSKKPYYEETSKQLLGFTPFTIDDYDWREIIYQMALDYFKYANKKDNFSQLIAAANPEHYPTGITGYESYYTDLQGFWRQLYHPGVKSKYGEDKFYELFTEDELKEAARNIILTEVEITEDEDIAQLFIDYIYNKYKYNNEDFEEFIKYDKEEQTLSGAIEANYDNTDIKINDRYLSSLYALRENKLKKFETDEKIVSNTRFLSIIVTAIKSIEANEKSTGNKFRDTVERLIDIELKRDAVDFATELINYIYDNYDKDLINLQANGMVEINHPHLLYLLKMREEKLYEIGNDYKYMENNAFIKLVARAVKDSSNASTFKAAIEEALQDAAKDLKTDHAQEILDYIYNNYNNTNIVSFDESKNLELPFQRTMSGKIEVKNEILSNFLADRKRKIDTYTNYQVFIDNDEFCNKIVEAMEYGYTDKEKYQEKLSTLLKTALTVKKQVLDIPSIVVQATAHKSIEVTDEQIKDKLDPENKEEILDYFKQEYNDDGWNKNVKEAPEVLNFWFDFMNAEGDMHKFSAHTIGNRPKAINDTKITGIYFQETPPVLFLSYEDYNHLFNKNNKENLSDMSGYTFIRLSPSMENYFTISAQGKSAKDQLDELLYQHTNATETVTLTAVPIYHLQPNTRIFINDKNTGINGDYIINKITIPLQYNGTSSITAARAVERIY